ncbi:MAG: alpha/beta fold hydrolase [Bacteroidetes bacterium]|nr:alpha/beta fold hydrolase [Bacteroidota bacterium]
MLRSGMSLLVLFLLSVSAVLAQGNTAWESKNDEDALRNQKSIEIQNGDHIIGGSIAWHDENYQMDSDLVILISGSGAMDRDATIAGFKPFRVLASELAQAGYSTFRYDDRGVGTSTGETDATIQDLAGDVIRIVDYFNQQNTYKINDIYLLGHSQGAVVAYSAAERPDISGVISMAGPAVPGDEIINRQIYDISERQGIPDSVVTENIEFQNRLYETVKNESGWRELEEDLKDRLWEQLESLPQQSLASLGTPHEFIEKQVDRQLESARSDWFRSFIQTDPLEELQKLDVPVLALFGDKDTQVGAELNREALQEFSILYESDIRIVTISNANHLFQNAITGSPDEYANLDKSFSPDFTNTIIQWLDDLE